MTSAPTPNDDNVYSGVLKLDTMKPFPTRREKLDKAFETVEAVLQELDTIRQDLNRCQQNSDRAARIATTPRPAPPKYLTGAAKFVPVMKAEQPAPKMLFVRIVDRTPRS